MSLRCFSNLQTLTKFNTYKDPDSIIESGLFILSDRISGVVTVKIFEKVYQKFFKTPKHKISKLEISLGSFTFYLGSSTAAPFPSLPHHSHQQAVSDSCFA